jgi:spore maturation protein CgeB
MFCRSKIRRARVPVALYGPGWGERPKGGSPPSGSTTAADLFGKSSRIASEILKNIRKEGLLGGFKRSRAQQIHRREIAGLMPLFRPIAQGGIAFEQIRKVFAAHEVILNFSNVWADGRPGSSLIPHVRLRDFEAPMCRTCYLSGHTDELAEFYEIGKEIDTYRSYEELVDKARYYLRQPAAAESLRERGYQRAIRDHTWVHRFEELFRKTGINQ